MLVTIERIEVPSFFHGAIFVVGSEYSLEIAIKVERGTSDPSFNSKASIFHTSNRTFNSFDDVVSLSLKIEPQGSS